MNPADVVFTQNGSPIANPLSQSMRKAANASGPSRPTTHMGTPSSRSRPTPALLREDSEDEDDEDESAAMSRNDRQESFDSDDSDDLPDPEAYAAHIQAKKLNQTKPPTGSSHPSRPKRKQSILWRDSLLPHENPKDNTDQTTRYVPLPDGTFYEIAPLDLDSASMEEAFEIRGFSDAEREVVRKLVRAEVVKALRSRMDSWSK